MYAGRPKAEQLAEIAGARDLGFHLARAPSPAAAHLGRHLDSHVGCVATGILVVGKMGWENKTVEGKRERSLDLRPGEMRRENKVVNDAT